MDQSVGTRSKALIERNATAEGLSLFASWKKTFGNVLLQTDLNVARYRFEQAEATTLTTLSNGRVSVFNAPAVLREVETATPNIGVAWSPSAGVTYRAAWQDFMRSGSSVSLASQNTAGISMDVPGLQAGGRIKRLRLQGEWELAPTQFLTAFADQREIRNLFNTDGTVLKASSSLAQYDRLRQQSTGQNSSPESLEGSVNFAAGTIRTEGVVFESIANSELSWTAAYIHARTDNELYPKVSLPQFPEHTLRFGVNWLGPQRWVVRSALIGRSERTADAQGSELLEQDWDLSISATWQDTQKRRLFEVFANRLGRKDDSATLGLRGIWRF
ncbi:MAG: hypothetical protein CFE44_14960 [Burkholderiales bacterium PBB4]|nr:MAG: hypothetical protein CFE44_14960 [Burkholderiales bacterium PBB4]